MSKVSGLIDPTNNNWDEDLVRQTSCPIDAQWVPAISLAMHEILDFIALSIRKKWDLLYQISLFCGMGPPIWEQVTTYQWDGTYHGQSYLGEDLEACLSSKG